MPSRARVELGRIDPDAVRTRLELGMIRNLRSRLGAGWRIDAPDYARTSAALEVDAWMGSFTMEPRVRRLVEEARHVLGVDEEVEVHPTGARLAAAHRTDGGPLIVSLHWRELSGLDDGALLAVLGHELGHHVAHNGTRPDGPDPRVVYTRLHDDRSSEVREIAAAYSRAAELTADRFALLACQDLDAALRLFAALSDDPPESERTPDQLLAAWQQRAEGLLARKKRARGDSHPEAAVRGYAAWLFWESDLYRSLTGRGPGRRPILHVDGALAKLVGPSDDAVLPFDEPTWMDGVGEAIYEKGGALGRAIGDRAAKIGEALRGGRAPLPPRPVEVDEEPDPGDPGMDDLEERFAALERRMGGGEDA
jgi:hypothetical protein